VFVSNISLLTTLGVSLNEPHIIARLSASSSSFLFILNKIQNDFKNLS